MKTAVDGRELLPGKVEHVAGHLVRGRAGGGGLGGVAVAHGAAPRRVLGVISISNTVQVDGK
jgi:hypothetical protein